jgi:hypothetical protein
MFADAQAGLDWLKSLGEVEPPARLVENILRATTGTPQALRAARKPAAERLREWAGPVFAPVFSTLMQPRFALSFGMAFFSITVLLNAAGFRVGDLRHADLRPSAVHNGMVRQYYETQARVVKYYENIRLVYEIESRVRDLKKATTPEENTPPATERERKNNTSEEPDLKNNQNWSRDDSQPVLASLPQRPLADGRLELPTRVDPLSILDDAGRRSL